MTSDSGLSRSSLSVPLSSCGAPVAVARTGAERATLVRRTYALVLVSVLVTMAGVALGYGDLFQVSRFLALPRDRGLRVVAEFPKPMVALMRSVPGTDAVVRPFDRAFPVHYVSRAFNVGLLTRYTRSAVLEVIRDSVQRRGYPPSMREIGEAVGLVELWLPRNVIGGEVRRRAFTERVDRPVQVGRELVLRHGRGVAPSCTDPR